MNKKFMIVCVCLLMAGAVLFTAGFALAGWDISAVNIETSYASIDFGGGERAFVSQEVSAKGITRIVVEEPGRDVYIGPSDDGKIHIERYGRNDADCSVTQEVDTLTVRGSRGGIFSINLRGGRGSSLRVLVPTLKRMELSVSTAGGDILIGHDRFKTVELGSASGDVEIAPEEFICSGLTVSTVSGDVRTGGVSCGGDISLSTTSGDVSFADMTCGVLNVETTSGDITGRGEAAGDNLALSSTSGDISVERMSPTGSADISTTSGEIKGSFTGSRGLYTARVSTVSGSSNMRSFSGGRVYLNVNTISGDIALDFKD